MKKRIIKHEDFPMVLDWSGYKNTHTLLPCKCQRCNCVIMNSINTIETKKNCICTKCGYKKSSITKKERYGDDYSKKMMDKIIKTNNEKYGKNYGFNYEKSKKTCLEKYGVENVFESSEIIKKIEETNLKKYGTRKPFQSEQIQKKVQNTHLIKYNSKCPIYNENVNKKMIENNLKKFGVPNIMQVNRELWQIEITSSKDNFENYLKSLDSKKTTRELSDILGFKDRSTILDYINKFDLWDYIDTTSTIPEKELADFINSLGFETQKKRFEWGEIDILIKDKNIGFEFNGCYWHSDLKVNKNYHYDKVTNAQNEKIRLIHIWDYEWIHNRQYIESYIKAQLGLCEKRIFARKCEIKEIDFKTVKPLLEYHQQKATPANHYIGLYHENELVLVMLFSKTTKGIFTQNPIAEWEVKREICKEGYSVVGGKSKVFNYFVKTHNPESVVSYVDRGKFTGRSYEIMGFKLDHINPARYDWIYRNGLIFKKRQPKIYKEMKQLYNENKVLRVYDSGRYCYVWKKNG
jgi:hypothetical protein